MNQFYFNLFYFILLIQDSLGDYAKEKHLIVNSFKYKFKKCNIIVFMVIFDKFTVAFLNYCFKSS